MSQKKVEQYKENKKRREELLAKEKRKKQLTRIFCIIAAVFVVGWFGYSIYNSATQKESAEGEETYVMDLDAYTEYKDNLSSSGE